MSALIPLQNFYLAAIADCANAEKLSCILQDTDNDTGRLWLVSDGSSVPHAQIAFKFAVDDVRLGVLHRDERELVRTVRYAEGLDGFIEELRRFLRANRIAGPRRAA